MRLIRNVIFAIQDYWCYIAHSRMMYAGGRSYECATCHRRYLVGWAKEQV